MEQRTAEKLDKAIRLYSQLDVQPVECVSVQLDYQEIMGLLADHNQLSGVKKVVKRWADEPNAKK